MDESNNYGFSEAWKPSEEYPGYMEKRVAVGNVTCDVYRPILTPEEREKREKQIMHELARIAAPYLK